jgi:hypothetical protein
MTHHPKAGTNRANARMTEADQAQAIRHLRQLIEALNRRVPHIERAGEATIARDAADLLKRAQKRLKALESRRE